MTNKILKTETIEEFLKRGGKVTSMPPKTKQSRPRNTRKSSTPMEEFSHLLPTSLKIRYGVKDGK